MNHNGGWGTFISNQSGWNGTPNILPSLLRMVCMHQLENMIGTYEFNQEKDDFNVTSGD